VPLYVLLELIWARPSASEVRKIVGLLALACTLAVLMISFKLAAWLKFPMKRLVGDYGVLPLLTSLQQLFDYSLVNRVGVVAARFVGLPSRIGFHAWGSEETGTALSPFATLFALIGMVAVAISKPKRRFGLFALLVLLFGLALSSWSPAWEAFRRLNGGNFRVASRCLGMAAFALSVFAALGADAVFSRWKRAALPLSLAASALMCGSALWWTHAAGLTDDGIVLPTWMDPLEKARTEQEAASKVHSFDWIRRYRGRRDILEGTGYTDGFLVVGNDDDPMLWVAQRPLPILFDGHKDWNVGGVKQKQITTEHFRVKIRDLPAHSITYLRLHEPEFGLAITTVPPNAALSVHPKGNLLVVENQGDAVIDRVVLRARLPISIFWPIISALALFVTVGGLCWLADARRRELSVNELTV